MIDIEAIKARADKAARKWASSDFYKDSAEDVPTLIAALEASETTRVKAEQELNKLKIEVVEQGLEITRCHKWISNLLERGNPNN